MPELKAGIIR